MMPTKFYRQLATWWEGSNGAQTAGTSLLQGQLNQQTALYALSNQTPLLTVATGNNASTVWYTWTGSNFNAPSLSEPQSDAWVSWQNNGTTYWNSPTGPVRIPPRDPAEEARHEARLQAELVQRRVEAALRDVSSKKAAALLNACLSDEQRKMLAAVNYFEVTSARGTRYRVYRGQAGNIVRLEAGREVERLCIHPRKHSVPNEDAMLIQKLMIETEEDRLLSVANHSRVA